MRESERGQLVTSEISRACVKGPTEIGDRTNDSLLARGATGRLRHGTGVVPDRRPE